ncbi:MAG: class I SAM-dependent methyltransferase [Bdellovibrionota bacterium]
MKMPLKPNFERLSAADPSPFPSEWYRSDHVSHFWMRWRTRQLQLMLDRQKISLNSPLQVLDAGCGIGVVRSQLEACSHWTIDGAELNEFALQHQLPSRGRTFLYDVRDLRSELLGHYDLILALDVLEHLDDTAGFLRALSQHLKPGGWLAVNVPALSLLYSAYDAHQGHRKRYTPSLLADEIAAAQAGFTLADCTYWGFSLVPIALARKVWITTRRASKNIMASGFEPPAPWVNSLLLGVMHLETGLGRKFPLGTSVMALCRKAPS